MFTKQYRDWMQAGLDSWLLGAEASAVVGLRLAKIANGGVAGMKEAELMVSEKIEAAADLNLRLMTGQLGTTPLSGTRGALRHYRRKVAANQRRLSR